MKRVEFDKLKRMADAASDAIAVSVANDRLEVEAAQLESACDRLAKLAGAALVVSDLRVLVAEFEGVARCEVNERARAAWMEAHRRPGGGR